AAFTRQREAADVSLIAAWLTGSQTAAGDLVKPYGAAATLTQADDTIFYTDVEGVTLPATLRPAPYDHVQDRLWAIRGGHKKDPAVVITRTISKDSDEGVLERVSTAARPRIGPGERYYWVKV